MQGLEAAPTGQGRIAVCPALAGEGRLTPLFFKQKYLREHLAGRLQTCTGDIQPPVSESEPSTPLPAGRRNKGISSVCFLRCPGIPWVCPPHKISFGL